MNHLQICHDTNAHPGFAWVDIDAANCQTLRGFYEAIADALVFPEDFGYTMESLDEFLNDLSWIDERQVVVYFYNSEHFLVKERNQKKLLSILDMLDATCEDWKWAQEDGDEEPKELRICFSPSEYMTRQLQQLYGG